MKNQEQSLPARYHETSIREEATIAAIATPLAVGGISVIRISGREAIAVAGRIFRPADGGAVEKMKGNTCVYGHIVCCCNLNPDCEKDVILDDGILTVFRGPRSYTGEDVCEISCHGGIYITRRVLREILSAGAVPASAGEFTKRALLNGKLSLTQAEAVADMIAAQGEQARKSAVSIQEGRLFHRIQQNCDRLLALQAGLAAWTDYPDEDIPEVRPDVLLVSLQEVQRDLTQLIQQYDSGKIYREGVDTVIAGRPNVGKSTLMNLLAGCRRSIVTDIAGTTRDVVEESVRLGDVILRLADTAGLRDTGDIVERQGVLMAKERMETADLILAVFDNGRVLEPEDFQLMDCIRDIQSRRISSGSTGAAFSDNTAVRAIAVVNKCDQPGLMDVDTLRRRFSYVVCLSAREGQGVEELQRAVEEEYQAVEVDFSAGVIANERQKNCLDRAIEGLRQSVDSLSAGETLDVLTVLLDETVNPLLELTGKRATEAVIDEVFSRFCVGK